MAAVASGGAAQIDWGRTIAYVDHNGSEMERSRLRGILGRAWPDAKVIRALEARQNEDGGFPYGFVQGRLSTIESTVTVLGWLYDLGLAGGPHAERALIFLLAAQRPNGSWDEPPGLLRYNPPSHLVPGDPRVRVMSTALVGYWLARTGARDDAVGRAAGYLRAHQAPDGRFAGFLQATWLATAFFRLVEGAGAEPAAHGLEALAAVDASRWRPGALAGALCCFGESGVDDHVPVVARSLALLSAWRRPDGSWGSEDGDAHDVEVTLQALRALLHYAAALSSPAAAGDDAPGANSPTEGRSE